MGLIPSVRRFEADACAQFKPRENPPCVFQIGRAHDVLPVERSWCGNDGESLYRPLEKGCKRGEGGLTILILSEVIVGLKALEPHAGLNLMMSA